MIKSILIEAMVISRKLENTIFKNRFESFEFMILKRGKFWRSSDLVWNNRRWWWKLGKNRKNNDNFNDKKADWSLSGSFICIDELEETI